MFNFFKRNILFIIIFLLLAILIIYWFYWHLKPFTPNAFVFANSRPVSPLVEGFITEIKVKNNQFIKAGDVIFSVFKPPYSLKIKELEHEIESKKFDVKYLELRIEIVKAEIQKVEAELANNQYLANQAKMMLSSEAVSATYTEERIRSLQVSEAELIAKHKEIESLQFQIGSLKSQIKKLESSLDLSKVWYELTDVKALSDGFITNLTVSAGGYYKPGEVICGFIDNSSWFVQANFRESELSQIGVGTKAKIWLRQYPGRFYRGVVEEINWGVERREMSKITGLGVVKNENDWFLLPQRFPVQIKILDVGQEYLTLGGSAYVELEIPSHPIRQFFWELFLK